MTVLDVSHRKDRPWACLSIHFNQGWMIPVYAGEVDTRLRPLTVLGPREIFRATPNDNTWQSSSDIGGGVRVHSSRCIKPAGFKSTGPNQTVFLKHPSLCTRSATAKLSLLFLFFVNSPKANRSDFRRSAQLPRVNLVLRHRV